MNSTFIKAALSAYFRFTRQLFIMATEVGRFNSDFLIISKDELVEIEIKTSRSDLNADFKKDKHKIYENANSDWAPNFFYFAVPKELLEYAVTKCVDNKYGVMLISDNGPWTQRVRIVKRAKRLHTKLPSIAVEKTIIKRLASEMANLRIRSELE